MEPPPPTFQVDGAALRRTRMRQGLGTEQVADAAGITRSYLSRLETGKASGRVRPGTYASLRAALNATDHDLLAPTEDTTEPEKR